MQSSTHCSDEQEAQYKRIADEIAELVCVKQRAYGDSFGKSGKIMRVLYPNGISCDEMDSALAVVRVIDKLFRIATDQAALGESPWADVIGYSLLAEARARREDVESGISEVAEDIVSDIRPARPKILCVIDGDSDAIFQYIAALDSDNASWIHKQGYWDDKTYYDKQFETIFHISLVARN